MEVSGVMFALLRFELFGEELCERAQNAVTPENLPALYKLSKKHDLAHLVGNALEKNGLLDGNSEAKKRFLAERSLAVYRLEQQAYEFGRICQTLEEAEVDFLPLKGSVIRAYYPKPWQRTSCDIDILVPADKLDFASKRLHEALGYEIGKKTVNDLSLFAPSGVHLELHYDLTECGRFSGEILGDIWRYASVAEGSKHRYLLCSEALYFYHIAHMVKHFEDGGCGVRPFLDLYLLSRSLQTDEKKREEMLSCYQFSRFARACEKLARVWFEGEEYDELSKRLETYILSGGAYGTLNNRVALQQAKKGGKIRYLFSRIFISNQELKLKYPALEKRPYLAPFYHIKRWFKPLTDKESGGQVFGELSKTSKVSEKKKEENTLLLTELGL